MKSSWLREKPPDQILIHIETNTSTLMLSAGIEPYCFSEKQFNPVWINMMLSGPLYCKGLFFYIYMNYITRLYTMMQSFMAPIR